MKQEGYSLHTDANPATLKEALNRGIVQFGNTGLFIETYRCVRLSDDLTFARTLNGSKAVDKSEYLWRQHYEPQPVIKTEGERKFTNTAIYASALDSFISWLRDEAILGTDCFQGTHVVLTGVTNATMHRHRLNLFDNSPNIYAFSSFNEVAGHKLKETRFAYEIDLNGLVEDSKVMRRIERISQHCQRQNYRMQEP